MAGFAEWLREKARSSVALGEIITLADANATAWPSYRDDPAPYVQFILSKAPAADQERLVAEFLAAYAGWNTKKPFLTGPTFLAIAAAIIALAIIGGMFFGLLEILADADHARGLITFLFATCTISVILIVVISVIWMDTNEIKDRFAPAKDIVTILIGVLGTILGFYFGTADRELERLAVPDLAVAEDIVAPDKETTITGTLGGGSAPYRYSIVFEGDEPLPPSVQNATSDDGAVSYTVKVPAVTEARVFRYTLTAQDANGKQVTMPGRIFVAPGPAEAPADTTPDAAGGGGEPEAPPEQPGAAATTPP